MSSYSNRHGYGGSPMGGDYPAIPRAARTPHFPEPSVRGHQYGHAYAPTGRAIPSPPGSLSPVAMASARSAVATGPQQTMDAGPSRPSAKAGMSILLAGAIIGGLIGAVMHARQNAADAIAAATMRDPAPITAAASASAPPALAPLASASGGVITNFPEKTADKKDAADKKDDKTADKDKKDDKKAKKKVTWTGGGKKAGPAETVASAEEPEAPAPKKSKKSKDDDDGYTIASADGSKGDSSSSSSKADKAEKSDKAEKKESSSKKSAASEKETKASGSEKKSSGKGGDDAVNVLKAAMGATENTL